MSDMTANVLSLEEPSRSFDSPKDGQLKQLREVGFGYSYSQLYWQGPLFTVGLTLMLASANLTLPLVLREGGASPGSLVIACIIGTLDAYCLALGFTIQSQENRRLAALSAKTGRPLLPRASVMGGFFGRLTQPARQMRLLLKRGAMRYIRSKTADTTQGTAIAAPTLELPALEHLRSLRTEPDDFPTDLRRFFDALDTWRTVSDMVSTTRQARTIIALENLDRCVAEFAVEPKSERDGQFLQDLEQTAGALADRMMREADHVSEARAHERSAEMRAIAKSADMDS